MNPFHAHAWTPYHSTEIFYLSRRKSHVRLFEVCQICKARRQVDMLPDDVQEHMEAGA